MEVTECRFNAFVLTRVLVLLLLVNNINRAVSIHCSAFSLDAEQPDYDLDSEDEAFVNRLKKKMEVGVLQFEQMIDRLEKGSGQQVLIFFVILITLLLSRS